ncbi:MAG TPA: hypothetical protein VEI50_04560 [Nitrospiraceae bacterium]|nr:hypothetical protein [Nitrospiraceae bacterium]
MMSAQGVVQQDLRYICNNLSEEFSQVSGKHLLVTCGTGLVGHYFI